MPRVDEMIDQLGRAQYLSTLDLTRGYWQVPVSANAQHKTAFATPFGLFEFRRMPFGLQGAPATFQRMMDRLLDGLGDFAKAYIDDLIIFSTSWEDHLKHLRTVLQRLQEASLTVRLVRDRACCQRGWQGDTEDCRLEEGCLLLCGSPGEA